MFFILFFCRLLCFFFLSVEALISFIPVTSVTFLRFVACVFIARTHVVLVYMYAYCANIYTVTHMLLSILRHSPAVESSSEELAGRTDS